MKFSTGINRLSRACLFMACIAVCVPAAQAEVDAEASVAAGPDFVVVTSRDDGPYEGVVAGIRGALGEGASDARIDVVSLKGGGEDAMSALYKARGTTQVPLITVGSVAARAALDAPGTAPVVACMIVDEQDLRESDNATGVLLDFPLETQLEWMQRFVPKSQVVGVLYNPAENEARIVEAKKIAKRLGLTLVAQEVNRPQDLPDALNRLARKADILWSVTDQVVLSRQTAQAILLFSFRNRMPFSGLSASWVKAGALYALDRDYEDLGAQCAEMAMKVRNGRSVNSLPPVKPRKVVYALNLKTAEHLKLSLPPEIIDGAAEVFR